MTLCAKLPRELGHGAEALSGEPGTIHFLLKARQGLCKECFARPRLAPLIIRAVDDPKQWGRARWKWRSITRIHTDPDGHYVIVKEQRPCLEAAAIPQLVPEKPQRQAKADHLVRLSKRPRVSTSYTIRFEPGKRYDAKHCPRCDRYLVRVPWSIQDDCFPSKEPVTARGQFPIWQDRHCPKCRLKPKTPIRKPEDLGEMFYEDEFWSFPAAKPLLAQKSAKDPGYDTIQVTIKPQREGSHGGRSEPETVPPPREILCPRCGVVHTLLGFGNPVHHRFRPARFPKGTAGLIAVARLPHMKESRRESSSARLKFSWIRLAEEMLNHTRENFEWPEWLDDAPHSETFAMAAPHESLRDDLDPTLDDLGDAEGMKYVHAAVDQMEPQPETEDEELQGDETEDDAEWKSLWQRSLGPRVGLTQGQEIGLANSLGKYLAVDYLLKLRGTKRDQEWRINKQFSHLRKASTQGDEIHRRVRQRTFHMFNNLPESARAIHPLTLDIIADQTGSFLEALVIWQTRGRRKIRLPNPNVVKAVYAAVLYLTSRTRLELVERTFRLSRHTIIRWRDLLALWFRLTRTRTYYVSMRGAKLRA